MQAVRAAEAPRPRWELYESRCTVTAVGRVEHSRLPMMPSASPAWGEGEVLPCLPVGLSGARALNFIVGSDLACCLVLSLEPVLKGQDLSVSSYCIHDGTKHSADCGNATQFLLSSSLVMGFKTQPVGMLLPFPCLLLHPLLICLSSVCPPPSVVFIAATDVFGLRPCFISSELLQIRRLECSWRRDSHSHMLHEVWDCLLY